MEVFGDNLIQVFAIVAAVTKLVAVLRKQGKAQREIQELRRSLQEETEKRERLQDQVGLLSDKVNRKD